jgi:MoaA/NifB/PqqE/SkfB family radical SAM enzyme
MNYERAKNPILFPITFQCNLDCVYCHEKRKKSKIVDTEKAVELICNGDNDWVYITGGEPLLVPNIIDICKRLKSAGKMIGLTTNGTQHKFEILNEIDRIGVSLDGDEKYTNENRGEGTYQKAVQFLTEAVKYPIETVIMATFDEPNEKQQKHLEDLGNKLGVTYLQETQKC